MALAGSSGSRAAAAWSSAATRCILLRAASLRPREMIRSLDLMIRSMTSAGSLISWPSWRMVYS